MARRALVLHWVSVVVGALLVVVVALNVLEDEDPTFRLASGTGLLAIIAVTQWLLRSGRPRAGAHLFSATLWTILAVGIVFSGGISSVSAPVLSSVTLIAGLVLGVRAAIAYTAVSILFLFAVFLARDVLPPSEMAYGPFASLTTVAALLVFTAGVLALGLRQLERAIAEARAHQAALLHKQRLESIGLLAGAIAHDFNNLLTVIMASSDSMRMRAQLPKEVSAHVDDVQEAARRASELTRQLLTFGRKQALRPTVVDVNELVSETERLLRRVIPERIRIAVALAPELPRAYSDPTQLSQVLINLAVNGRDAIGDSGTIRIRTDTVTMGVARAQELDLRSGRYVAIEVADDGSGIPPEILDRIFDPFFTTKGIGQGTGLGLSTTLGIVQQSGGAIEVKSELGRGAVMRVYLPEWEPSLGPPGRGDRDVDLESAVREALATHDVAG